MKKTLLLILTLILILPIFAGCEHSSTNSTPAQPLKVGLRGTSIKPVGVLVADAKGYFKEEGVDVEFENVSSMNDAFTAVSTGDLDLYLFSCTSVATFTAQGTNTLKVIGGTASEGSEIMAKKGSTIQLNEPSDFKGLTIGCTMPETGQIILKNYLKEAGLSVGDSDDKDVIFKYVNEEQNGIEALKNGEFDLMITNTAKGYYADDLGVTVVKNVKDFISNYPCCRQTCYSKALENNYDALVAFEIATIRGHLFAMENEEETLDILEKYSGENRDYLRAQIYGTDDYKPAMRLTLDPDKKACKKFYEAMMDLNETGDTVYVDWNDVIVTDVYKDALDALINREPDNATLKEMMDYYINNN